MRIGPREELVRVEYIVDFGIFENAVGVDTGAGRVEVVADEGIVRGDVGVDRRAEVVGYFGDHRRVDRVVAGQRHVLDHRGLERRVARALAVAEEARVVRRAAVEPGRRRVHVDLVEVVVPVPFEQFRRIAELGAEGVHHARHRSRQNGAGIGDAVAHRVAEAHLDRDLRLDRELEQLLGEREAEAVDVGAGDVLEMAARDDAFGEAVLDDAEVGIHHLRAVGFQLEEDMIVGYRGENPRFLEAERFDEGKVTGVSPDPRGDFGKLMALRLTEGKRLAVFFAVNEKFGLPDKSVLAAELVHEIIDVRDLLGRVGRARLLAVAEGRIGDPDMFRKVERNVDAVEPDARNGVVRKLVAIEYGLRTFVECKMLGRITD